jgi:asparagine synthetase B (glutamine-hydrolysing)
MPGIFGLINNNQSDFDNNISLSAMAQSLVFMPEQEIEIFKHKWYCAGTAGYGKSFTFLKRSSAVKDNVLLIMDGEVFPDASDVPHELAGNSPTVQRAEYCLYLYLKYGTQFIKQLNGNFVIAVFDTRDRRIHLFNDRFGSEPIYIWQEGNEFAFSTSQRSLLSYRNDIGRKYDKDAIAELIVFERILGDKTLFHDIRRLVTASHAVWDGKQLKIEKYWTISDNTKNEKIKKWKDAAVEFHRLLKQSIAKRLSDNAKVGALISGGIDSRLLLSFCPESTVALTFSNKDCKHSIETILAGRIAKLLGHEHILLEREMDHYAKVAELAVEVNESVRTFAACHSLGLHQKMLDIGIRAVITGQYWDTFFKGMYSTESTENDIYRNEPFILQTRRIGRQVADSLILRRQKHQDLTNLALSQEMKERSAIIREKMILLMQSLCVSGDNLGDCSEKFRLHDLQSTASMGFQNGLRTVFPDRSPCFDNDLFSFALYIPLNLKKNGQIVRWALKLANPKLSWIKDANTGLPAGLCPPWNQILGTMRQFVRNSGKRITYYSKSFNKLRQPASGCRIFKQHDSWHDRNGLFKFNEKYRSMIESAVENLDESIFDKNILKVLFQDELNAPSPRLEKLWEIVLSFGLFDQKYGLNVIRKIKLNEQMKISTVDLTLL